MNSSLLRLLIAVGLLVGVGIGYGIWYRVVAAESEHAAELKAQIETKSATQARAAALRAAIGQLVSDEALIGKYLVSAGAVVGFLEELEGYGAPAGSAVKVLSVSPGNAGGKPVFQIALTISGTFSAIMNTVGRIEYAPYHISVTSLAVNANTTPSADADASLTQKWTANMAISVGSIPTASSTPVAGTPLQKTATSSRATTTSP
jgi:hypothetical protein